MEDAGTGSRTAMLNLTRPPRPAAFAVTSVMAGERRAALGGAKAAVPAARRGYDTMAANADERNRLRSNNTIQRSPRSAVRINLGVPLAAPLMVSVRPLRVCASGKVRIC
jgi:hypothetical protein